MSLLIPPPPVERASVVLPSITCSSCSVQIPLVSLGDHVCAAPPAPVASRPQPPLQRANRPPNLTIPPSMSHMTAMSGPSARHAPLAQPAPAFARPPFAGPSSAHTTPSTLSPHSINGYPSYSPAMRTPSPTNPFFPHPQGESPTVVHGLGLGVGSRSEGPYPTDRPFPASIAAAVPELASNGTSGMAGVGRRAFAANTMGRPPPLAGPSGHTPHMGQRQPSESPMMPIRPAPWQSHSAPTNIPQRMGPPSNGPPTARSISPNPPKPLGPPSVQRSLSSDPSIPRPPLQPLRRDAIPKESSILPKAPLSGRQRSETLASQPSSPPRQMSRKVSASDTSNASGPGIAQLLKQRSIETRDAGRSGLNPQGDIDDEPLVLSPVQTTFSDNLDEDDESALPWAKMIEPDPPKASVDRYQTSTSSSSSFSSSRVGGLTSGPESEEVVTPSASWEGGLAERAAGIRPKLPPYDERPSEHLTQISEEDDDDEGERVIFGGRSRKSQERIRPSGSTSTITPNHRANSRSRTHPSPQRHSRERPLVPDRTPSRSSSRTTKTCQKCGDTVGGAKRFVERDGVVLCEKDWKKLYLPSCRRCNLPIEKSAVSSSDGQLKGKWHRSCFTCTRCDVAFEGDSFYVLGGKPWCQKHYHEEK